jgi:5'-AMP-activated protein kinase catalytic alpha subunit
VGNYVIEKTIGQGTYGKVKLAHHIQSKDKVAIKVIDKATIENDRQVKRIQKEIRFLKVRTKTDFVK